MCCGVYPEQSTLVPDPSQAPELYPVISEQLHFLPVDLLQECVNGFGRMQRGDEIFAEYSVHS